jgi:hypothetical protein
MNAKFSQLFAPSATNLLANVVLGNQSSPTLQKGRGRPGALRVPGGFIVKLLIRHC